MSKLNCDVCKREGWTKDDMLEEGWTCDRLVLKMDPDTKKFTHICLDCLEKISSELHK